VGGGPVLAADQAGLALASLVAAHVAVPVVASVAGNRL